MSEPSKDIQIKLGAILGYVNYALKMIMQLVYVPIMLRLLGQSEYGVYQLVASIIAYFNILNLAFGGAYYRFFSQCRGDKEKEANLNGTYLLIFLFFGVIAAVIGAFLTINSDWILGDKLTLEELRLAKRLLAILVANMVLTFPSSVFSSIVLSRECFIFQRAVEIIKTIINPFLVISLLLLGYGSIGIVLATTAITIFGLAVNIWYVFARIKTSFYMKALDVRLAKEIGSFSFFILLDAIVDQINWNVDKLLLGRMVSSAAIAIYSVGAQINNIFMQITDMLASILAPRVNSIVAYEREPMPHLNALFTQVGRLQALIVFAVISGFLVFGKEFISLWAGEDYGEAYYVTLLLIIPMAAPLCQTLGVDIQRALSKHQYRSLIYTFSAILNLLVSIPLIRCYGAIGAALGTAVAQILGEWIIMNILYQKKIGLDIKYFWKQVVRLLPTVIPSCIVTLMFKKVMPIDSLLMLAVGILIFLMIYIISILSFGLNVKEKKEIHKMVGKIKK